MIKMDFKLKPYHRNVPDEDLLNDLKLTNNKLVDKNITRDEYDKLGKYSSGTITKRFGTWNKGLKKAGIKLNGVRDIKEIELFNNIEAVWITLGRQPKYSEMKKPLSKYSAKPYEKRYGTWLNALQQFVNYINLDIDEEQTKEPEVSVNQDTNNIVHKTKRNISERMRFRILMRDGFTCQSCGKSPIKERDVELHVDHIIPWSKGGETIPENLATKCKKCNLGKGNAFDA